MQAIFLFTPFSPLLRRTLFICLFIFGILSKKNKLCIVYVLWFNRAEYTNYIREKNIVEFTYFIGAIVFFFALRFRRWFVCLTQCHDRSFYVNNTFQIFDVKFTFVKRRHFPSTFVLAFEYSTWLPFFLIFAFDTWNFRFRWIRQKIGLNRKSISEY